MLLSYRNDLFEIPHTSQCNVHTSGVIHNLDKVEVSSPIFASVSFFTGEINTADTFEVSAHIIGGSNEVTFQEGVIHHATLVCDDNDVFSMYVRIDPFE